ncbi:MAG: adenylyltransferase/cytidyltransferase family protein [Spirochaetia bacterium]|jgi:rfaE bifunctional protein nucleotidyltransferase chain/domain
MRAKAPRRIDTVFRRRAIFIDSRSLENPGSEAIQNLRWLGRYFRLVNIAGESRNPLVQAGIIQESLPGSEIGFFVHAQSIEAYASWFIGDGPALGFRKVFPCPSSAAAGRALRAIRRYEMRSPILVDYELLEQRVAAMRRRGLRIVFTNGVFDLLHIGHLRLLEDARSLGDRLVVAINSDDSTKKIKGGSRPVIPQFARAELLTRLRQVDCCCIFTEIDPRRVLSIVRPDVLAKGCDYSLARIVGARFVRSYGGTVARLPLVEGYSTTSTIRGIGRTATFRR